MIPLGQAARYPTYTTNIYYKEKIELKSISLSIISDDLDHDAALIYKIHSKDLCYIKQHIGDRLKKVHYFSDGCGDNLQN